VWSFVVNGILGFRSDIDMKRIVAEREVYAVLEQHIVEPGRYVCNPPLTSEGRFPDGEPVFGILYGGMGHEAAGGLMLVGLVTFFFAPAIGAWMLSMTGEGALSSYPRKVLFFAAIGLLFAVFGHLPDYGIGAYPLADIVALSVHDIVVWTLVGLVVARIMRPRAVAAAPR
jgi:hypothetical protein